MQKLIIYPSKTMAAHALVEISHIPLSCISLIYPCVEGKADALKKLNDRLALFEYAAYTLARFRPMPNIDVEMGEIDLLYAAGEYRMVQEKLETLGRRLCHAFVGDRGLTTIV